MRLAFAEARRLRFASLGSGSRGNALVVEAGNTRVLLDCGFSFSETVNRLARKGLSPEDIDAIVVTHEHDDHVAGVMQFARRMKVPVYLTSGTMAAIAGERDDVRYECFDPHTPFTIGALSVEPYPVPHDAREPAQYVFGDGARKLGVLTDVGMITPHIRTMLNGCAGLVLETNHDAALLSTGPYPPSLKSRIGSRDGHLENTLAGRLLAQLDRSCLQHVVAAHLSQTNNTPALARAALANAAGANNDEIVVATQANGFDWLKLD
jgi:phosphoribosyl 1,2-cyclic phosphodiesterase